MPQADPLTETRRERFRAYCRRKGWFDEARQKWAVTDIAAATYKPTNKVSDLLNGNGSFGGKIARELEAALGMENYALEAAEEVHEQPEGEPMTSFEPHRRATIAEAMEVLGEALFGLDELGRKMAAPVMESLVASPQQAAALGLKLQMLVDSSTPPPAKRKGAKQPAAAKASKAEGKARLSVTTGGGQKRQLDLALRRISPSLRAAPNPFREEHATESEGGWYKKLKSVPKARAARGK